MTLKSPAIRAIGLGLIGVVLTAAGQFPIAATTAGTLFATGSASADNAPDDRVGPIPAIFSDDDAVTGDGASAAPRPALLATLVARIVGSGGATATGDRDCLARAVYFEARGEPLEGQLAVAQVILYRLASGRHGDSVCGVVAQPGQFTYDHRRTPAASRDWQTAKAIAAIAATAAWDVIAPRATAFHAVRINAVSSGRRVGTIGNHVFYR